MSCIFGFFSLTESQFNFYRFFSIPFNRIPLSSLGAQGKRTTVPTVHDHDIFTLHLVSDVDFNFLEVMKTPTPVLTPSGKLSSQ